MTGKRAGVETRDPSIGLDDVRDRSASKPRGPHRRKETRRMKRLALIVLLLCTPALAHDASRPELNSWFDHLASGKGLCCSFADGMALSDVDWESANGHYRVRLDGQWIDVPDDAVITEPNRAGRTMVWPMKSPLGTSIRCFMPGSMT
jgi:hypothetical protein